MRRKTVKILWGILGGLLLTFIVIFVSIWNGWVCYMPDFDELGNPVDRYASQVFSSDGVEIGTWSQSKENRLRVPYDSISPHVIHALVATEDARYYEHSGVDFYALGRSIIKRGMMGDESAGGGSTITQQLAKQLYSEQASNSLERIIQKPVEWVIALKLERHFTKEEIIAMYLNQFDFLYNAVGIKMAANRYFSKEPWELNIQEAATLVGLCKNPAFYNPIPEPNEERALQRRNTVMQQMVKAGYLSESEYDHLSAEPIVLNYRHMVTHKRGEATYFREFLRQYMTAHEPVRSNYPSWGDTQYYVDSIKWKNDPLYGWCNKNTKRDGSNYNLYTDGLKIYTTIDTRMQKHAEEAVDEHVCGYLQSEFNKGNSYKRNAPYSNTVTDQRFKEIMSRSMRQSERWRSLKAVGLSDEAIRKSFYEKTHMMVYQHSGERDTIMTPYDSIRYYKSFLRSGFISIEPSTGHVKAYVGGINYNYFKYDMVSLGRRQVGSTIKPFLYSLAMMNGYTPESTAPNVQRSYGGWTPRNGSRARYGSHVPLRWGLQQSNNWISAYLIDVLTPQAFADELKDFGIDSPDIEPTYPLCLGACESTVCEMVSAYTTFANKGMRCSPIFVTKIEDADGNVIANFEPRISEVLSPEAWYYMLDMLQAVSKGGTGTRLRSAYHINGELGCKTGTTNSNSDAWFIGFTPQLVSGGWVGGEDRDIHFDSTSIGQGAAAALPIWAKYMNKLYDDPVLDYDRDAKFEIPEDYIPERKFYGGDGGGSSSEESEEEEVEPLDVIAGDMEEM